MLGLERILLLAGGCGRDCCRENNDVLFERCFSSTKLMNSWIVLTAIAATETALARATILSIAIESLHSRWHAVNPYSSEFVF